MLTVRRPSQCGPDLTYLTECGLHAHLCWSVFENDTTLYVCAPLCFCTHVACSFWLLEITLLQFPLCFPDFSVLGYVYGVELLHHMAILSVLFFFWGISMLFQTFKFSYLHSLLYFLSPWKPTHSLKLLPLQYFIHCSFLKSKLIIIYIKLLLLKQQKWLVSIRD